MRTWAIFLINILLSISYLNAQDTLRISLPQADSLLVARNLSLIISRYDVDKADAMVVQEKLFRNPDLYTEWSAYNQSKKEWLDAGASGQKIIQLQQVFKIAGQRRVSIALAEEQKQWTKWQYYELARSLRYELHVSYYRYYFLNHAITNIRSRLNLLQNLIGIYEQQYAKGNISLQELTRLKSVYFDINNQVNTTQADVIRLQERLHVLLADNRIISPVIENAGAAATMSSLKTLPELIDLSLHNRPEIGEVKSIQTQSQLRYSLERKQAVPNIMAGAVYDQSGSYIHNYTGVSLGLQIPLFNRNQGKIRAAKFEIDQSNALLTSRQQEITQEVTAAFRIYQLLQEQYRASGTDFEQQLDQLSKGLVSNYSKNNISLLEFTDMFEAYNSSIIQLNQLKADLNKSYEELNYAVGEDLAK